MCKKKTCTVNKGGLEHALKTRPKHLDHPLVVVCSKEISPTPFFWTVWFKLAILFHRNEAKCHGGHLSFALNSAGSHTGTQYTKIVNNMISIFAVYKNICFCLLKLYTVKPLFIKWYLLASLRSDFDAFSKWNISIWCLYLFLAPLCSRL